MRQSLRLVAVAAAAVAIQGCPIFPAEHPVCLDDWDCAVGYQCNSTTGNCELAPAVQRPTGTDRSIVWCAAPDDCPAGETCIQSGVCIAGSCASAGYGCVAGYRCQAVATRWTCVPDSAGEGGAAGANGGAGASRGGAGGSSGTGAEAGAAAGGASGRDSGGTSGIAGAGVAGAAAPE